MDAEEHYSGRARFKIPFKPLRTNHSAPSTSTLTSRGSLCRNSSPRRRSSQSIRWNVRVQDACFVGQDFYSLVVS